MKSSQSNFTLQSRGSYLTHTYLIATIRVLTFEPIKFLTCSKPHNVRLIFSLVNDVHVDGKKWLKMVGKWQFINP